jgi:hypothetical protein
MVGIRADHGVRHRAHQVAAQIQPVTAQVAAQVKPVTAQVAAQVKPVTAQVAAQVKPVARSAGAATRRGVYRTRVWAAPQVERSGQVLNDTVAPKVSALLSAAAQRIEPTKPQRRRWPRVIAFSLLAAAASAAAAAVLRGRMKSAAGTSAVPAHPESPAAADMSAPRPADGTEAEANSQVRAP